MNNEIARRIRAGISSFGAFVVSGTWLFVVFGGWNRTAQSWWNRSGRFGWNSQICQMKCQLDLPADPLCWDENPSADLCPLP